MSSQPVLSATLEATEDVDTPDADLQSLGQSATKTLVLPLLSSQATSSSASETPEDFNCADTDLHLIGKSIAETYEVPYQQVMTWFCSGYSFENILIALETSQAVDIQVDTLLQMILEKEWEEVWAEIGFVDDR